MCGGDAAHQAQTERARTGFVTRSDYLRSIWSWNPVGSSPSSSLERRNWKSRRLRLPKAFLCNVAGCESEVARMALSKLFCSCLTFYSKAPSSSTRAAFSGWHHITAYGHQSLQLSVMGTDFWPSAATYHLSQPVTSLDVSLPPIIKENVW